MRNDLIKAKASLSEGHACAVCRDGETVYADGRGIAPLLSLVSGPGGLEGYTAADRVIGSAAAYILVEAKVREAYAVTMSEGALRIFADHGVVASYQKLTAFIRNRAGDGLCPMEERALGMDSPEGACAIFRARLAELKK